VGVGSVGCPVKTGFRRIDQTLVRPGVAVPAGDRQAAHRLDRIEQFLADAIPDHGAYLASQFMHILAQRNLRFGKADIAPLVGRQRGRMAPAAAFGNHRQVARYRARKSPKGGSSRASIDSWRPSEAGASSLSALRRAELGGTTGGREAASAFSMPQA